MKKTRNALAVALAALLSVCGVSSCSSPIPNREPLGERFPSAEGETLEGESVRIPEDLAGSPAILIIGYVQKAQFDADRWLFGILQARTPVRVLEVPTIPGLVPSFFSGTIDSGMRSGIPREDWASVVTLYGSRAGGVRAFTGNQNPRNVRVLLIDEAGVVRWFHDRGFSAGKMLELDEKTRSLLPGE